MVRVQCVCTNERATALPNSKLVSKGRSVTDIKDLSWREEVGNAALVHESSSALMESFGCYLNDFSERQQLINESITAGKINIGYTTTTSRISDLHYECAC